MAEDLNARVGCLQGLVEILAERQAKLDERSRRLDDRNDKLVSATGAMLRQQSG